MAARHQATGGNLSPGYVRTRNQGSHRANAAPITKAQYQPRSASSLIGSSFFFMRDYTPILRAAGLAPRSAYPRCARMAPFDSEITAQCGRRPEQATSTGGLKFFRGIVNFFLRSRPEFCPWRAL